MSTSAQPCEPASGTLCPEGRDPLVSARHAFFRGTRRHGPATRTDRHRTGDLQRLLDAEYAPRSRLTPAGPATALSTEDITVARLRHLCRLAVPLTPGALLAHDLGGTRLTAVLAEMWPETVRGYGKPHAELVLRHHLLTRAEPDAARIAFLLDCAESAGLHPLTAAEASARSTADDRPTRHALWRYLHRLSDGPRHLPAAAHANDPYEQLLLAPPTALTADPWPARGIVVAQTMLQGDLDAPGQGLSGGLSVLLGGLGDRLAENEHIGQVLTVVTAGHDGLARDPRLLYERGPDHWVLRLPVDTATTPPQDVWPAHRTALSWWATRLLGVLPRRVDVLHVRYADDSSLALAHAAERTGARLLFTATPDPHRTVAHKHADTDARDPERAHLLRSDLHRIFCADRLVDRADEVIGIPGPSGTQDLLHHFPVLEDRYGPTGPAAPPEGIAPYVPAPDENALRQRMLDDLFADGSRGDTLSPDDRGLPLMLCVGRLHPVKQQDLLVRTWLTTELWRTTTLVVVGGSDEQPSEHERSMHATVRSLLTGQDAAAARLAMVPAMPNGSVRRLERALADTDNGIAAWYVCPSAKEEFGIAILEAMEAGLPVAGPRRGGVAHYLRDGVNGILLDTSSSSALARGLHRIKSLPETRRSHIARAAHHTATTRYALGDMADALATEYLATAKARHTDNDE
ncbi:glycosyltransferase family 4 protein [Streptomyces sp. KL116D]|uniref:glycosyltransferase family 4 protein n=1 Tax=Streptomyces sp. KL116D TaxID=3045152 RepID=UPI0035583D9B